MLSNARRALVVTVFSAIAGVCSFASAAHGYGGGHWHGGGYGRGGGFSYIGGHGYAGYGRGGYGGWRNYWGGGSRYYAGYSGFRNYGYLGYRNYGFPGYRNYGYFGYRNYGWPYNYFRNVYYRPYVYGSFGYPYSYSYYNPSCYYGYPSYYSSYANDYDVIGDDYYYGAASLDNVYVVSRPVSDVAQVQFRLPDPQATIWVQGKEIASSGNVRQFKSPQLDPSHEYTYTVKAEWKDNGKLVSNERQVKVQANALAVVDFTQPSQADPNTGQAPMPDLPPPQPRPTAE